jgi:hypothetical protein
MLRFSSQSQNPAQPEEMGFRKEDPSMLRIKAVLRCRRKKLDIGFSL